MGAGAGGGYWDEQAGDVRHESEPQGESDGFVGDVDALGESVDSGRLRNPLGREGAKLPEGDAQLKHIFRRKHLVRDTPETREKIIDYTKGDDHYLDRDKEQGNLWFADKDVDADQFWVEVRGRTVKDAGINRIPH